MQTCVLAMQSFMTLNDQDPFLCDLPPDHLFADSLPPTWSLGRDEDWIYISRLELNCRLYESEPSSEVLSHARPFYRLCRHAYDHKARKERPSATLSRDQFTPQFVAEVDRALKQFAEYADTDVLAAGEAFNTVFWTAVRAGSPELLKIALAETRWNVCCWCREPLADMLVECADKVRGEVLSLLITDRQRFGIGIVRRIVDAVDPWPTSPVAGENKRWKDKQVQTLVQAVLEEPQVNPGVVWQMVLQECMDRAVEPKSTRVGTLLVRGGWQLVRARAARHHRGRPQPNRQGSSQSTTTNRACARPGFQLIVKLSSDVQLRVLDYLDFGSMCRLRSCCRQLRNELPMGRFTRHFFERELHLSARPGYVYDSLHFQSLLGSIPTASGPSTLDYRMLVEAVRHLDIDLAMRFLSPTDPAYNLQQAAGEHGPGFVRYVYAWALYVLLFESNVQVNIPGACRLLVALLEHPDLPDAACILLALAYPTTELLLPLVDHAHKLNPTRQYLVCLLESGTFPAALPDTVRAQLADPSSATPHLVLAFSLTHFSPHSFTQLVDLVPLRVTPWRTRRSVYVQSLVRLAADKLVQCTDTCTLDRVLDWMLLELESPDGCASPELVCTMVRRVLEQRRLVGQVGDQTVTDQGKRIEQVEAKMKKDQKRAVEKELARSKRKAEGQLMCIVQ